MILFDEFFAIIREFQKEGVRYALVGGVAMAFYDEPRFTRDIDFLVHPDETEKVRSVMERVGYFEASKPWTFANTQLTLHRFIKTEGEDCLTVDILYGSRPRHMEIVEAATDQPWAQGVVKIARKHDIIWMKEQRGSDQDKVDIRKLKDDKNRNDDPTSQ